MDIAADKTVTAMNREDGMFQIPAKAVILAMGCRERPRGALNIPGYRPAGIFSAGTGQPYFTTDTGSSLRGVEIEADVMLKGTRVDGVYTADPEKDPTATKFNEITYQEVLERGLKVMDLSAVCMCQDNNLPIYVFNMDIVGNLKKVMNGEEIGTLVHP